MRAVAHVPGLKDRCSPPAQSLVNHSHSSVLIRKQKCEVVDVVTHEKRNLSPDRENSAVIPTYLVFLTCVFCEKLLPSALCVLSDSVLLTIIYTFIKLPSDPGDSPES